MVEEEAAKRIEELVQKRVEEELEKRKEEIEAEVQRRVEEAKRAMERQMMEEMEWRQAKLREEEKRREVRPIHRNIGQCQPKRCYFHWVVSLLLSKYPYITSDLYFNKKGGSVIYVYSIIAIKLGTSYNALVKF